MAHLDCTQTHGPGPAAWPPPPQGLKNPGPKGGPRTRRGEASRTLCCHTLRTHQLPLFSQTAAEPASAGKEEEDDQASDVPWVPCMVSLFQNLSGNQDHSFLSSSCLWSAALSRGGSFPGA